MVRFAQQRARECRTANYGYGPIISAIAAEGTHADPDEAVKTGRARSYPA
jgi:hypothetical protein